MTSAGRPSWAPAVPGRARGVARPPLALVLAGAGAVVLAAAQVALVVARDDLRAGPRGLLVALLAAQVGLVALVLRRSPAAAMLLGLCLVSGAAGAVAARQWALVVLAAASLAGLARALRWFPGYEP